MYEIIGLDLGTYNVKTSSDFLCKSIYEVKKEFNLSNKDMLEHNGIKYRIGVGTFDTEIVKADKKDTLPLFLYALSKSTLFNVADVKVVMGLPKTQIEDENSVKRIKEKFIGDFSFRVNGDLKSIKVLDLVVFPEGLGAYYTINNELGNKDVILIDIGGSTIHIGLFEYGEYKDLWSIPYGTLNVLHEIYQRVLTIHGGRHTLEDIDKYLTRGRVGKTNDTMPYTYGIVEHYVEEIFSSLKLKCKYENYDFVLTGGGCKLFSENILKRVPTAQVITDNLFANAKGFKKVGEMIFDEQNDTCQF